jgi:exonuclease III
LHFGEPNWAKYVKDYNRVLGKSRIQILRFNGLLCGNLRVINSYIVNNPTNKANLWELLKGEISRGGAWILCGDFNMVEQKEDKSSQYEKIIIEKKFDIVVSLKSCFRLDIQEPLGLV